MSNIQKRIFIRHAEKNDEEAGRFIFDPEIMKRDEQNAINKFIDLVTNHGIPDKIFCSPYLRTRQTALIAQKTIFGMFNVKVEILVDSEIRDYINIPRHRKDIPDIKHKFHTMIRKETKDYGIMLETPSQGRERLKRVANKITREMSKNVWYISHGSFIKMVIPIIIESNEELKHPMTLNGYILNIYQE